MNAPVFVPDTATRLLLEGEFEAKKFFQSLLDQDESMDREAAGRAFFDLAFDEFIISQQGEDRLSAIELLHGFFGTIGELLWELAEKQRGAIQRIDSLAAARPEPPNEKRGRDAD